MTGQNDPILDPVELARKGLERLQQADDIEMRLRHGQRLSTTDEIDGELHTSPLTEATAAGHLEHLRQTATAYIQAGVLAGFVVALLDDGEDEPDG